MLNRFFARKSRDTSDSIPSTGYQRMGGSQGGSPTLGYFFDGGGLQPMKASDEGGNLTSFSNWLRGSGVNTMPLYNYDATNYARAYMACVWAFRAVNVRAQVVASVLKRGRVVTKDGTPLPNHPLMRGIEAGQRAFHQDFWERWAFSLAVFGENYTEKVNAYPFGYQGQTLPVAVRILNTAFVEMIIQRGNVMAYDYTTDAGHTRFATDEVVYDRLPHPLDEIRGYSLIAAALNAINVDVKLLLFQDRFITNNARPGLVFTPKEQKLQSADIDLVKSTLREDVKGIKNAGRPLLLPMPFDVLSVAPPDLEDFGVITNEQKRRICSSIGVPAALVDYTDMAYQLSPEQNKTFYNLTVIPAAEAISVVVGSELLPFFDQSGNTRFELPVNEIREEFGDPSVKVDMAARMLQSGGITLNEWRQRLGEEPIEGGDVLFMPANVQLVRVADLPTYKPPMPSSPFTFNMPTQAAPVQMPSVPEATQTLEATETEQDGVCIALRFANQPDLIALQQRVKSLYATENVEWNDPASFHVTLLYAPTTDDDQITSAVKAMQSEIAAPTGMQLTIGSLNSFDNIGEHALHFKIRQNANLNAYQETLYEAMTALGIQISAYSVPNAYIPHITVGYSANHLHPITFKSKLTVQPSSLVMWQGDETVLEVPLNGDVAPTADDLQDEFITKAITEERNLWRRYSMKHGALKAASFACETIPAAEVARLQDDLLHIASHKLGRDGERDAIATLFTKAEGEQVVGATPEQYHAYWGNYDQLMSEIGSTWLNDYMQQAGQRVIGSLGDNGYRPVAEIDSAVAQALEDLEAQLVEEWVGTEQAPGALTRMALGGMAAGNQALVQAVEGRSPTVAPDRATKAIKAINFNWSLQAKEAIDFTRRYAFDLIKRVNATTRDYVRTQVTAWLERGGTVDQLVGELNTIFNDPARADLIAQTESTRAYNAGAKERWSRANVKQRKWNTVNDGGVCPTCDSLNGEVIDFDGTWKGGIEQPPAHPGCRCFSSPFLSDEWVDTASADAGIDAELDRLGV